MERYKITVPKLNNRLIEWCDNHERAIERAQDLVKIYNTAIRITNPYTGYTELFN